MAGLLHDTRGRRLYLTGDERAAFLAAAARAPRPVRTFCGVLCYTGCRVSEALQLTPRRVDAAGRALVFETLKKRRKGVYRAVPVPPELLDQLDRPLWPWTRGHAWRRVKAVMRAAGVGEGPHATAKGLRHGYGVHAIGCGVPLNLLSRWMGHASLEATAVYADALGAEEQDIAARMWN